MATVTGIVLPLAGILKVRSRSSKADIDSWLGKLHYRTTATICLLASLLVSTNDLVGSAIQCIYVEGIPKKVINTYCWMASTFSLPGKQGIIGKDYAFPGVGPHSDGGSEARYHAYYQWVPFVLFLEAVLFYLPHHLWKILEDRKMDKVTNELRGRTLVLEERRGQCAKLVKYIQETFHWHNFYAVKFAFCESLNLLNVIGQAWLLNEFLGGAFLTYGWEVLTWFSLDPEDRSDPFVTVFPTVTKCTFHTYGPSGTVEKHDTMCVLAHNILNQMIFAFLWFWLALLAVATLIHAVVAVVTVSYFRAYLLGVPRLGDVLKAEAQFGDWLVLFLLRKNMDRVLYNEFITQLSGKIALDKNTDV